MEGIVGVVRQPPAKRTNVRAFRFDSCAFRRYLPRMSGRPRIIVTKRNRIVDICMSQEKIAENARRLAELCATHYDDGTYRAVKKRKHSRVV